MLTQDLIFCCGWKTHSQKLVLLLWRLHRFSCSSIRYRWGRLHREIWWWIVWLLCNVEQIVTGNFPAIILPSLSPSLVCWCCLPSLFSRVCPWAQYAKIATSWPLISFRSPIKCGESRSIFIILVQPLSLFRLNSHLVFLLNFPEWVLIAKCLIIGCLPNWLFIVC